MQFYCPISYPFPASFSHSLVLEGFLVGRRIQLPVVPAMEVKRLSQCLAHNSESANADSCHLAYSNLKTLEGEWKSSQLLCTLKRVQQSNQGVLEPKLVNIGIYVPCKEVCFSPHPDILCQNMSWKQMGFRVEAVISEHSSRSFVRCILMATTIIKFYELY